MIETNMQVFTSIDLDNETIFQEVLHIHKQNREVLSRELMNLKDAQIRDALLKLGWTPPDGQYKAQPPT